MGYVYLTVNMGPGGVQKLLVLKQLREDFASSGVARAMFLDEARISTRLNHPNIVQTNEVVDDEEDLYLVMEFLDGQPLSRILDASHTEAFSLAAKLRILVEALEGLHYAHELKDYDGSSLNMVHRDVSPQNIIVTYDGHVKLVDFGVAKAADTKSVTESGMFKGKVRYASPEQALCLKVDRRADVFAVGTILWEILCGRRMWQDPADASVLLALASGNIPRLRDALPEVPPALDAICSKALATDINARYATALELREALLEYLRENGDATPLGPTLTASFGSERRRLHAIIDTQMRAARETVAGAPTVRNIPLIGPDTSGLSSERSLVRGGLSVEPVPGSRRPRETRPPPLSRTMAFGVVAVLAVIGVIALLVPSRRGAQASAAAAAHGVHVSLRATPSSARFTLDGKALDSNPFEAELPRDDVAHALSIRADGFEQRDIDARLARDLNVDVTLAALAPPPLPVAPSASPAPSSSPAVNAAPRTERGSPPKALSQRQIDEDDPYKR